MLRKRRLGERELRVCWCALKAHRLTSDAACGHRCELSGLASGLDLMQSRLSLHVVRLDKGV